MKVCVEATSRGVGCAVADRYPCLKEFNLIEVPYKSVGGLDRIRSYIEIAFLSDILDIMNGTGESVVIHKKDDCMEKCFGKYDCDYIIEIYDDWRE